MGALSQDTIDTWIRYYNISSVLAERDQLQNNSFKGGVINKNLALLLQFGATTVQYAQQYYLGEPAFEFVAMYVYALTGKYRAQADILLQNPSGIIPTPTGGQPVNIATRRFQFFVQSDLSPFIVTGDQSVYTITDNNILIDSLDLYISGVQMVRNDPNQNSFVEQYFANGMIITLNFAVQEGMEFMGRYWVLTSSGSVVPPASVVPPTFGESGKFLANDGNESFWNAAQVLLTSADFEPDGVTWIPNGENTRITSFDIQIILENVPILLTEATDWVRNFSDGGFTILMTGFDASLNPDYRLTVNLFPKT